MESLDQAGIRLCHNKSSLDHDYLTFYERFFEPLRNKPIKILEIGIGEGDSMNLWYEYFPNAQIVMLDKKNDDYLGMREDVPMTSVAQYNDRTKIEIWNEVGHYRDFIRNVCLRNVQDDMPFDIIIDDASHCWQHQKDGFRELWQFVKPGGYYIIEDLHTSHEYKAPEYTWTKSGTALEWILDWTECVVSAHPSMAKSKTEIDFVSFRNAGGVVCLIGKRFAPVDRSKSALGPSLKGPYSFRLEDKK